MYIDIKIPNFSKALLLVLILLCSMSSSARFAKHSEASAEVKYNIVLDVEKDGKTTEIFEKYTKILNEKGREKYGSTLLFFTKESSDLEIIEAKVVTNGVTYKVSKENIEIKPLASSPEGFDQSYQVLISFPNITIGSQTYLKWRTRKHEPEVLNHFFTKIRLGQDYTKDFNLTINSKIPGIKYKLNDPKNIVKLNFKKKGNKEILKMRITKPVFHNIINEPASIDIPSAQRTSLEISTLTDFSELGNYFAPKYEKILESRVPAAFKDILAKAKKIENVYDQINFITSSLNKEIRYMGDWRSVKGKFFPRELDEIVKTGYGDCKDFSIITTKFLRELGYEAYPALVHRGVAFSEIVNEITLPTTDKFNHAIVAVENVNGKTLWIDPTNFVSMAQKIFPDISARNALILNSSPKLDYIPAISSKSSQILIDNTVKINQDSINRALNLTLKGEKALNYTAMQLYTSQEAIKDMFITMLNGDKPNKYKVSLPDLSSRIVKDITLKAEYQTDKHLINTNYGKGLSIYFSPDWVGNFVRADESYEGVVFLSEPEALYRKIRIKNYPAKSLELLNYNIKNNWFIATRECIHDGEDVVINEKIELLDSFINPDDIKTKQFKDAKNFIKQNFSNAVIIGDLD